MWFVLVEWVLTAGIVLAAVSWVGSSAEPYSPELFKELRWRMIGPFRGGRTKAATGVPSQPNVFYIGVSTAASGSRPTTGALETDLRRSADWLDRRDRGRASNPNVIYVGSGEGLQRPDLSTGDGIYKSTDGGKTWTHLGLRDGQQIPQISSIRATQIGSSSRCSGHPYGPNEERGIFRSTRRRADVPEGPLQGREHRRERVDVRSVECEDRLRRRSGKRGKARGRTAHGRGQRQRPVQVHRRRQHLETVDQGLPTFERGVSDASASPSRPATRTGSTRPSMRARRSAHLQIGRRR